MHLVMLRLVQHVPARIEFSHRRLLVQDILPILVSVRPGYCHAVHRYPVTNLSWYLSSRLCILSGSSFCHWTTGKQCVMLYKYDYYSPPSLLGQVPSRCPHLENDTAKCNTPDKEE